jgi:TPR repeat protein
MASKNRPDPTEAAMVGPRSRKYDLAARAMERDPPDAVRAFDLLEEAWAEGDPRAAQGLGMWYLLGSHHIRQNKRRGLGFLHIAAAANAPKAWFNLGMAYDHGYGVRASQRRAFDCFLKAALHGDGDAALEVARCYHHGLGVPRDRRTARIWRERAEELGVDGEEG